VRTIVNLRTDPKAKNLSDPGGTLRPVHLPVRDGHAPTKEQALEWLNLCVSAARPMFIHCHEGRGRTGTFCALVRLAQGWDIERAIAEEIQLYEFEAEKDWRQLDFLRDFASEVARGLRIPHLDGAAQP